MRALETLKFAVGHGWIRASGLRWQLHRGCVVAANQFHARKSVLDGLCAGDTDAWIAIGTLTPAGMRIAVAGARLVNAGLSVADPGRE